LAKTSSRHRRRREQPSKHDDGVPGLLPVGLYALALPESWRIFTSSEIRQPPENMNMSSLACNVVFWGMVQTVLMDHRRVICMRGIKKYLASTVLSAALLFTGAANAMQIPQFDKLAVDDQDTYVTLLAQGAAKGLYDHGDIKGGDKLVQLFNDGSNTGGGAQFWKYLDEVRIMNKNNAADPKNKEPPYEVEHAVALMLKNNGIIVPVSFLLTINKDFKPSSPPSGKTKQTR
jgi:hypothetical protein